MFDFGPQTVYALIAVAIMLLVGFPVHEFMHAFAANRPGGVQVGLVLRKHA